MTGHLPPPEVLIRKSSGRERGAWQVTKIGDWLYISDGWIGDQGYKVNKSKAGNPFQIRVHAETLPAFIRLLLDIAGAPEPEPSQDDVPF